MSFPGPLLALLSTPRSLFPRGMRYNQWLFDSHCCNQERRGRENKYLLKLSQYERIVGCEQQNYAKRGCDGTEAYFIWGDDSNSVFGISTITAFPGLADEKRASSRPALVINSSTSPKNGTRLCAAYHPGQRGRLVGPKLQRFALDFQGVRVFRTF